MELPTGLRMPLLMPAASPPLPPTARGALGGAVGRARGHGSNNVDTVAEGFESLFLSQLVKQMRQTLEPGTMFPQDESDVLGGLFDTTMGQHLAKSGALGIGNMLKRQLNPTPAPPSVPGAGHAGSLRANA